jgi:hypothetical protein
MATDSIEDPKFMTLVREIEGIDEQICELNERRRQLLNRLEAMEA